MAKLRGQQAMKSALETLGKDVISDSKDHEHQIESKVVFVEGAALAFSTSIFAILSRVGSLVAAAISSVPIWRRLDPLAVLALSQDEREERRRKLREAAAREAQESGTVSNLIDGESSANAGDGRRNR